MILKEAEEEDRTIQVPIIVVPSFEETQKKDVGFSLLNITNDSLQHGKDQISLPPSTLDSPCSCSYYSYTFFCVKSN